MVNSIKSLLEIDDNTARKFTVVLILENCVNNIKYSMLSTVLTAKTRLLIIENVAIFDKLGNSGVHKFFKNPVINPEQRNRSIVFGQSVILVLKYRDNLSHFSLDGKIPEQID